MWFARTKKPTQLSSVCYIPKIDLKSQSLQTYFSPKASALKRKNELHTFYISLCMKKDRVSGWRHFTLKHTNWLTVGVREMKITLRAKEWPQASPAQETSSSLQKQHLHLQKVKESFYQQKLKVCSLNNSKVNAFWRGKRGDWREPSGGLQVVRCNSWDSLLGPLCIQRVWDVGHVGGHNLSWWNSKGTPLSTQRETL